jgi:hypothetical protein
MCIFKKVLIKTLPTLTSYSPIAQFSSKHVPVKAQPEGINSRNGKDPKLHFPQP